MKWFFDSAIFRWYRGRTWLGSRVVLVAMALLAAWLLTALVIFLLLKFDVADAREVLVGALLAWTGELIFFSVVGGIVSVVTLKDPAQASFDERIKILFGTDRLPDSVLNYNKRMVSRLAGYAEAGEREVVLEEYRDELKAYHARITTTYRYKNLLPDVNYDDTLPWHYLPDALKADAPIELAKILAIVIDGVDVFEEPILVEESGFHTELPLRMPPNGRSEVVFRYITWLVVGEQQTMNPRRLVEQFKMTIVNEWTKKAIPMSIEGKKDPILLLYRQKYPFDPVQSVAPSEKIFSFVLLPPQ